MAAPVPYKRNNPRYQEIQIGAPVRGRLWREMGLLLGWLRGHGMMLIPASSPGITVNAGETATLRFRVRPPGQAVARLWHIVLRAVPDGGGEVSYPEVEITYPDSIVQTVIPLEALGEFQGLPGIFHLEELDAKDGSLTELVVTVEQVSGTYGVVIESISCCELPRALLTQDGTDLGVDLETLRSGQPVYDGTQRSITDVISGFASTVPRRSLVQENFTAVAITSGTYTDVFTLPVPCVPSKIGRTATTRTISWSVYARTTLGSVNGDIRITCAASGQTATLSITGSTTFSWRGPSTVVANCESVSTADGLQGSSTWETVQIAMRVTAGVGAVEIEKLSVWEDSAVA